MADRQENLSSFDNNQRPDLEVESAVESAVESRGDQSPAKNEKTLNRVIKRFGGRHLIFRTKIGNRRILRRPYALVSTFRGPVWLFYGIGQLWITHKKYREFDGWMSRVPRVSSSKIVELLDKLNSPLSEFTRYCNRHGIEGTIVIEPNVIEFHWTFDYSVEKESMKQTHTDLLDAPFQTLVDCYNKAKTELGI